jgi:hypothetical protein
MAAEQVVNEISILEMAQKEVETTRTLSAVVRI